MKLKIYKTSTKGLRIKNKNFKKLKTEVKIPITKRVNLLF